MDDVTIAIRRARPQDAAGVAAVYISSWHDTYAGILPAQLLCAMTPEGQAARWRATIGAGGRERVLVAEQGAAGIVGMTSYGPARDDVGGHDGEIYTLYVDPNYFGCGIGRALLSSAFVELERRGYASCVIWAHAKNPVRYFYEAMGGRLVAQRRIRLMGDVVPEAAFGWSRLALAQRATH
ncbi:MAG: GNAT family N-acetyltransferase [Rhizomicrobium sp.]